MINIINSLPKHPTKRYGTRSLDQIQMIVVHHFASDADVEEVARWHVNDNGWPGIGYHFVIGFYGEVHLTNHLRTISYHCGGHNTRSVGIALRGNWSNKLPFYDALDELHDSIDMVRWAVGRDIPVYPHSAFRPTECPGNPLREYLEKLRLHSAAPLKYEAINPDDEMFDDDQER